MILTYRFIYLFLAFITGALYLYIAKCGFEAYLFLKERRLIYLFAGFSFAGFSFLFIFFSIVYLTLHPDSLFIFPMLVNISLFIYAISLLMLAIIFTSELFTLAASPLIMAFTGESSQYSHFRFLIFFYSLIIILFNLLLAIFITFVQYLNTKKNAMLPSRMIFFGFAAISFSFMPLFFLGIKDLSLLIFYSLQLVASLLLALAVARVTSKNGNVK